MNRKKENMKRIMNSFEEMMSAASFAEEGEFDTARKVLSARHRILLVLTGTESDMKAASYALNISERISAAIEILYIKQKETGDSFLKSYLGELKAGGIEHRLTQGEGPIKEEIIKFTDRMRDIQFVIIDSQDLGIASEKEEVLHGWEGLECPLVLVSSPAKG
jgi:hypothetical protein